MERVHLQTTTNGFWDVCQHEGQSVVVTTRGSWMAAFMMAERIFGAGKFWFMMLRRGFYVADAKSPAELEVAA